MNNELTRTGQWRGPTPIIRLAYCVVHNEVKPHYIRCNQVMTRRQLDDHNSAGHPLTAYEIIANKWNDDSFNPSSSILEVHPDFSQAIDITHAAVANLADTTASKVEDLLTQICTSLICVISDWEKSRQGEGGVQDLDQSVDDVEAGEHHVPAALYDVNDINVNDIEFGLLENRSRPALSQHHNFLRGKPSYLFYFWELMDHHQLLKVVCLDRSSCGTSEWSSHVWRIKVGIVPKQAKPLCQETICVQSLIKRACLKCKTVRSSPRKCNR